MSVVYKHLCRLWLLTDSLHRDSQIDNNTGQESACDNYKLITKTARY